MSKRYILETLEDVANNVDEISTCIIMAKVEPEEIQDDSVLRLSTLSGTNARLLDLLKTLPDELLRELCCWYRSDRGN